MCSTKTRKLLTTAKMHHPKADVDRLYLSRSDGGRGLVQLELAYKTTTVGLDAYLTKSNDRFLHQSIDTRKRKSCIPAIPKEAEKYKRQLNLQGALPRTDETSVQYAKRLKTAAKRRGQEQLQQRWEAKPMRGIYPQRMKEADVDMKSTNQWLKWRGTDCSGAMSSPTHQGVPTSHYQK